MIYMPDKYKVERPNINEEISNLKGELSDKEARIVLAKFLRANLGLGLEIFTQRKLKLIPYQEMLIKGILNRNFSLIVASRGAAKSYLCSIVAFLIPLFEPETNTLICGPVFRTARHIFNNIERILAKPEAKMLLDCFGKKVKRNDSFEYEIGNSIIRAIPSNSDKIRGFRANVLILDEFFLLSEDFVRKVLFPFLIVPANINEKIGKSELEDELIKSGVITEDQRMEVKDSARMICCTSASYTFEYVYKLYCEWIENIMSKKPLGKATYFIAQISYKALPSYLIEKSVIEEAQSGGEENPSFQREFLAQFSDNSESFYSALKMHNQTIPDGEKPTNMIRGLPGQEFILSIDPSWAASPTADNFAMTLGLINNENNSITVVHNYAKAGKELSEHIKYFYYLLKAFNIVLIVPDNADGNFIQSANESALFQKNNLKIDFIDYDSSYEGEEYEKMLKEVRKQYNKYANKICFKQVFNQNSIRMMNEQLQTFLNNKKIWFGSKLTVHPTAYEDAIKTEIPWEFESSNDITELISNLDDLIYQQKKECSLIEIRVNPVGTMIFDLPTNLKRNNSPNRARKDLQTSLLLLAEGFKAYIDIMKKPASTTQSTFIPLRIGKSTRY